jgi:hypothetical protein
MFSTFGRETKESAARGVSARLTDGGHASRPTWSRDGKAITYASAEGNVYCIYRIPADGSNSPQILRKGSFMIPNGWSPDGHLAFMTNERGLPFLSVYSAASQSVTPVAPGGRSAVFAGREMDCLRWAGRRGRRRRHQGPGVSRAWRAHPDLQHRRGTAALEPGWPAHFLHGARQETNGGRLRQVEHADVVPAVVRVVG